MTLVLDLDIKGDPLLITGTARSSISSPDAPSPFHLGVDSSVSAPEFNLEATSTLQGVLVCGCYPRIVLPHLDIGVWVAIVVVSTC